MTGAGITVLGVTFGLSWMLGIAIAAVLTGALMWRLGTRRRRYGQR